LPDLAMLREPNAGAIADARRGTRKRADLKGSNEYRAAGITSAKC